MEDVLFFIVSFLAAVLLAPEVAVPELLQRYSWRPEESGRTSLIGVRGTVLPNAHEAEPKLWVLVRGERWQATSVGEHLATGTEVQVVGMEGVTLKVAPVSEPSPQQARSSSWTWSTLTRIAGFGLWGIVCFLSSWAFSSVIPGILSVPVWVVIFWLFWAVIAA